MTFFSTVREIATGFKFGARYATFESHGLIEKGVQPKLSSICPEKFGR